jgi:hypothetical protein
MTSKTALEASGARQAVLLTAEATAESGDGNKEHAGDRTRYGAACGRALLKGWRGVSMVGNQIEDGDLDDVHCHASISPPSRLRSLVHGVVWATLGSGDVYTCSTFETTLISYLLVYCTACTLPTCTSMFGGRRHIAARARISVRVRGRCARERRRRRRGCACTKSGLASALGHAQLRAAGSSIYGEAAATRAHERPVEPGLGRGWQVRRELFRAPASLVTRERVHRTTASEVSQFRRDQSNCPDERQATCEVPRSFGTSERARGNEARGPPACWV